MEKFIYGRCTKDQGPRSKKALEWSNQRTIFPGASQSVPPGSKMIVTFYKYIMRNLQEKQRREWEIVSRENLK